MTTVIGRWLYELDPEEAETREIETILGWMRVNKQDLTRLLQVIIPNHPALEHYVGIEEHDNIIYVCAFSHDVPRASEQVPPEECRYSTPSAGRRILSLPHYTVVGIERDRDMSDYDRINRTTHDPIVSIPVFSKSRRL